MINDGLQDDSMTIEEEDNLMLKCYEDIMEHFKEEKGCKNPEMFLDCLGITFVFDTKSKKEKMIALKYLENCFLQDMN